MKICRGCRWFKPGETVHMKDFPPKCGHEAAFKPDLVLGRHLQLYCETMRIDPRCGPDGRLWEEQPRRDIP